MPATHAAKQANSTKSLRRKGMRLRPSLPPVCGRYLNGPRECASSDLRLNQEIISRLLCRGSDSRANRPGHSRLPFKGRFMSSRAEYYRRRGLEAQQRATQTTEAKIRDAFETVAGGWFVLAEQLDWVDRQHDDQQGNKN